MGATGTPPSPGPLVPVFDLRLEDEDVDAVVAALRSGWLTQGPRVAAFEAAFAAQLGARHAVAVSSGTAALHLAYRAAGVGPGTEVILPSFSFVATAAAVLHCGGVPVFADVCGLGEPSLDPDDVARQITARTRAVVAVHFAGYAAQVDELARLCADRGLALIEDAAHAPSASLHGRKLGTWGAAGAFSFFSNKVLAAGEGGLLATDDDAIADSARSARSHCMTSGTWERHAGDVDAYDVVGTGFNYRLDEPRAALLSSRLGRLEADVARRRELTRAYRRRLAALPGLILPYTDAQVDGSSCQTMPVMLADPARRLAIRRVLRADHAIQTSVMYPAIHELAAYRGHGGRESDPALPRTERAARSELSLPLFAHMTPADLDRVIAALTDALGR